MQSSAFYYPPSTLKFCCSWGRISMILYPLCTFTKPSLVFVFIAAPLTIFPSYFSSSFHSPSISVLLYLHLPPHHVVTLHVLASLGWALFRQTSEIKSPATSFQTNSTLLPSSHTFTMSLRESFAIPTNVQSNPLCW